MAVIGALMVLAGLVGLIRPSWLRLKNRWWALGVMIVGLGLAGAGAGDELPTEPAQPPVSEETPAVSEAEPAPAEPAQEPDPEPEPPLWTAEEDAYRLWVVRHTTEFSEVLRGLGGLLQDPRIWEQEWVIQVGARIAQMRLLVQEAQEQEAPETFASVHAHYMDAMDDYGYVAEHLPRAIDNLDADLMDELTVRMERGAANVALATEETQKVISERER